MLTAVETVVTEGGRPLEQPIRRAAAAAVVANPWLGGDPSDDLLGEIPPIGTLLADELTARVLAALGGADAVEAFGKGAVVGTSGELEHAAAMIHNPYLGDGVRDHFRGESIIAFADARGDAGYTLTVPMWHKIVAGRRSHYQTIEVRVPDAPRPSEILVAVAGSAGGRPWHRIGDRTTDVKIEVTT